MSDKLFEQVKRKLNITWSDEDTDKRVRDIIDDAIVTVSDKLGIGNTYDYSVSGREHNIFLAYCFYAYNNAEDEFDKNYETDILQLRAKRDVDYHMRSELCAQEE